MGLLSNMNELSKTVMENGLLNNHFLPGGGYAVFRIIYILFLDLLEDIGAELESHI